MDDLSSFDFISVVQFLANITSIVEMENYVAQYLTIHKTYREILFNY